MSRLSRPPGGGFHGSEIGSGPVLHLPSPTPAVKRLMILHGIGYLIGFIVFNASPNIWARIVLHAVGLSPWAWHEFFPFVPVWQLASYALLHDFSDPMHLVFNMLALYFFGTMLEGLIGTSRFVVTYVASIVVGGALWLLYGLITFEALPAASAAWPLQQLLGELPPAVVGASGGVFGVLVAAAVLMPNAQVLLFFIPIRLRWLALGLVAIEVLRFLPELTGASPGGGVARLVHLGGAAYGFAAVRGRWIWIDPLQRLSMRRAIRAEEKRVSDEQRVDGLLEKINREGMSALSKSEKEFLRRVSARR